jgi:hypothetical protein
LGDTGILLGALSIATAKSCDIVFQEVHKSSSSPLAESM